MAERGEAESINAYLQQWTSVAVQKENA